MPAPNVNYALPLVRNNPFYPGQTGVLGTDNRTGLRAHSTGVVLYVDPNYPGASDARDGTNPTNPLLTVAKALTLCRPYRGDVIVVGASSAWEYAEGGMGIATAQYTTPIAEEVEITVSGVRIVGVSHGTMGAVWTLASNGGMCITNYAMDTIIEGFVFTQGDTYVGCNGIFAEWDGVTMFGENMTVRNCVFDDTVDTAIQMEFSWYCDIHHNTFVKCDVYAIYVDPAGSGSAYNWVHDNDFQDPAIAIGFQGCDDNQIYGNRFFNSNALAGAAATNEGINTANGVRNMVTNNWFSCLLPVGAGDINDFCTSTAFDSWVGNHAINGLIVLRPT